MVAKLWTEEEEQMIIQNAKYDHRGFVCNCTELAELVGREVKFVYPKLHRMRKKGLLFEVYWDDPIEPPNARYSRAEEERIISMYKAGCPVSVMAEELNRTETAVSGKLNTLRKANRIKPIRKPRYTKEETDLLITKVEFDENGYVLNADRLAGLLHRSKKEIARKICMLRKDGKISIKPDRTKASKNWYDAMKKQIDLSYQIYLHSQKKPTSVAAEVSNKKEYI
ncbi:hypothetical protein P7D53_00615 [Enterococcus avium]|nr:hypothetical protein [Enterococcus avium]